MVNRKFKSALIISVFALIVGCIYVYPDIRLICELKNNYHGIAITATNDELIYLGRINAFYKGDNPYLSGFDNYECRGQPWTLGFFPEVFMGSIGKILKLSVIQLDILMSFILPIFLFLLIYALSLKLSNSRILSFTSSTCVLLGYHIFTGKSAILKNILSLKYDEPLWFLRPISPQFNHIMLILVLLLIYIALESKKSYASWASGIALGLLFYTFVYYWTFVYAGMFVMVLIFMMKKRFNYLRRVVFILLLSSVISIFYWINLWRLIHFPHYGDLEYFNNFIYTHRPVLPLLHIFLTIFILFTYYKKVKTLSFYYIAAFLIGGFICLNQHILTGKLLFPGHWIGYSNKTFTMIALFVSLKNFQGNSIIKKIFNSIFIRISIVCTVLCILFTFALIQQNNYFKTNKLFYVQKQVLANAFGWLKSHTSKNSVILTDPMNCMERHNFPEPADILVYTYGFSFLPVANNTMRSREELIDRYLISLAILGYTQDEVRDFCMYRNGINFLSMGAIEEYGGRKIDPGYISYLEKKYRSLEDISTLFSVLEKYRLDYILADKNEVKKRGILRKYNSLSTIYDDGEYVILKLSHYR